MAKENSTGFVTVACKLPAGLILHIDDMVDFDEPVMGGGVKTVKRAQKRDETVTIFGNAVPHGERPKCDLVAGYALTPNVPVDFWDAWLAQNKTAQVVKENLVFAYEKQDSARSAAKENRERQNGMQPLVPDSDPRIPKRIKDGRNPENDKEMAA